METDIVCTDHNSIERTDLETGNDAAIVIDSPARNINSGLSNDNCTAESTVGYTEAHTHVAVEELPEYASIVVAGGLGVEATDGSRTQEVYENRSSVNKDTEAARERTLISEAPPTYRQLFGAQNRKSPTIRQKLTQCRQSNGQSWFQKFKEGLQNNKVAATFVVSGGILLLLSLPISMVIIGGLNVSTCWRHEIPLYLLIGGFILIAEIVFQAAICIGVRRDSNHETICRTLRFFDCLAVFLFVWLLVGTYWIFTISFSRLTSCDSPLNDIVYVNTTVLTDSERGTQISVLTPSLSTTPAVRCSDCGDYVYSFTAFAIMFQYVALLVLFIFCCSVYFKKNGR